MLKRIFFIWLIANFAIIGLASLIADGWYIGWSDSPYMAMWVEIGLIMLPNLILSTFALKYGWVTSEGNIKSELGWKWQGWRSILVGVVAFLMMYWTVEFIGHFIGESIPYHLPETAQGNGGIRIDSAIDFLKVMGILGSLLIFVVLTVAGEESMFRGLIQTQVGKQYGFWIGLLTGGLLFGLRHLPNDIYYARLWQATPQMWISRQLQLYVSALILGLARYFGKSTYSSAIQHGLYLCLALFG